MWVRLFPLGGVWSLSSIMSQKLKLAWNETQQSRTHDLYQKYKQEKNLNIEYYTMRYINREKIRGYYFDDSIMDAAKEYDH